MLPAAPPAEAFDPITRFTLDSIRAVDLESPPPGGAAQRAEWQKRILRPFLLQCVLWAGAGCCICMTGCCVWRVRSSCTLCAIALLAALTATCKCRTRLLFSRPLCNTHNACSLHVRSWQASLHLPCTLAQRHHHALDRLSATRRRPEVAPTLSLWQAHPTLQSAGQRALLGGDADAGRRQDSRGAPLVGEHGPADMCNLTEGVHHERAVADKSRGSTSCAAPGAPEVWPGRGLCLQGRAVLHRRRCHRTPNRP